MSKRELNVGSIVHFAPQHRANGADIPAYRIEQRLELKDGATLYKIRSETEPFDRIVGEGDLAMRR
jgi:hypothetical protein